MPGNPEKSARNCVASRKEECPQILLRFVRRTCKLGTLSVCTRLITIISMRTTRSKRTNNYLSETYDEKDENEDADDGDGKDGSSIITNKHKSFHKAYSIRKHSSSKRVYLSVNPRRLTEPLSVDASLAGETPQGGLDLQQVPSLQDKFR